MSLGPNVNSPFDDQDPAVFADAASAALTLYFTSLNRPDGPGDYDIYTSSRGSDVSPLSDTNSRPGTTPQSFRKSVVASPSVSS